MATKHMKRLDDKFTIENVGSTLLNELAKGLYSTEAVIREYVQNAVDAHRLWKNDSGKNPEGPIQVEYGNNEIRVYDYGIGMNEKEVREVKSVAVSPKRKEDIRLTGHKGVGIWAGFSFFESLTLRTSKHGTSKGYQLTLNFQNILKAIDVDVNIGAVIDPNYSIFEYIEAEDKHYTEVYLENPVQFAEWFTDKGNIEEAIRRICPCSIHPNFVFQEEVTNWYTRRGFELFDITLDGKPVYKNFPSAIEGFEEGEITINDISVAAYWKAISKKKILKPDIDQLVGFRIIKDGFTVGNTNPYSRRDLPGFDDLKATATYFHWYVGEIHVITPDLYPKLPRDDFEESEARRKLVQYTRKFYEKVDHEARVIGEKRNLLKNYTKFLDRLNKMVTDGETSNLSPENESWLVKFAQELQLDEDIAKGDKRKKALTKYQIDARRDSDVKSLRKLILTDLKKIIPGLRKLKDASKNTQRSKISGAEDFVNDKGKEGSIQLPPQSNSTTPSASEGSINSQTEFTWPASEFSEEVGIGEKVRYVSVDVVFSLLEEILDEELSESNELKDKILKRLQTRINSIEN
jgi:hypothetical protein